MNAIKNITIGQTSRLHRPVGYTMLSNLINIVPFCLSIEAINIIFRAFSTKDAVLDTQRLWTIVGLLVVYLSVMLWAERKAYRANFRSAYEMSAEGRTSLAEHLRRLSLGFLSRHDPGDLSSMLITDFAMAETGMSHHLPQLMGALVMPILAFLSLVWINWRMAVAMFASLPFACLILWLSTSVQNRLSGAQINAKIEAGNRMEEYLQGIRVMKAYNLLGSRFTRLRDAFLNLKRAAIRQEALLGPFVLLSISIVRAGLTLMVVCGAYLLLKGQLDVLTFVMFLIVGSRVFDPLTSALTNFTEFRYFSIAGGRILSLMKEPEQTGTRQAPESGDITFEHASFAYQDKQVLHDICCQFPKNTLTALVGPSGSGKSTLMNLWFRFHLCPGGDSAHHRQQTVRQPLVCSPCPARSHTDVLRTAHFRHPLYGCLDHHILILLYLRHRRTQAFLRAYRAVHIFCAGSAGVLHPCPPERGRSGRAFQDTQAYPQFHPLPSRHHLYRHPLYLFHKDSLRVGPAQGRRGLDGHGIHHGSFDRSCGTIDTQPAILRLVLQSVHADCPVST